MEPNPPGNNDSVAMKQHSDETSQELTVFVQDMLDRMVRLALFGIAWGTGEQGGDDMAQ